MTRHRFDAWSSRGRMTGAAVLWTVALATVSAPSALAPLPGMLDPSWQVALELARRMHLSFGSRLLFPYGPYGYLTVKVDFFTLEWYEAVAASLAVHLALESP